MTASEAYSRAVEQYRQGKHAESILLFQRAVQEDPEFFRAYAYMALVYEAMRKPKEAIDCYLKTVLIKPDYHKAYNNLGQLYRSQGEMSDAIESFRNACRLDPANPLYHYNLGLSLLDLRRYEEAREALEVAFGASPGDAEIAGELSSACFAMNDLSRAGEVLEKFMQVNPEHPRCIEFRTRLAALRKRSEK